jgi:cell division protein FtsL
MARAATAAARTAPARRHPPQRRLAPARKPTRRAFGRTGIRAAVRPRGARILDALLSGRGWIALVGVLLAGIVFFNVDLLQMNREITRMADRAAQLKRENARTRLDVARLASSERIQESAAGLGLVLPAPAQVRYLKSRPIADARNAAKRMSEPDPSYVAPAPVSTAPDPALGAPDPALGAPDPAATAPVPASPVPDSTGTTPPGADPTAGAPPTPSALPDG